jgi:pSer/pThr/pTyr-binding forkhead associated (FHA) protein
MVAAKVVLTVTSGTHNGKKFVFSGPTRFVIGRAHDCTARLAGAFEDCLVSRHHCEVDVEAPCVRVHDLGSRNGTFVNGKRIMSPQPACGALHDTEIIPQHYELKDGDELMIGPIPLHVNICPE